MWLGSLRVRRFTGSDPWVGFPALPHRMFAAVGCVAGESPNVFSGRFRASDDSESSECLNRHHSSYLCPLWRFLRQIG